jgi:cysteinyl-tRNA synthetase
MSKSLGNFITIHELLRESKFGNSTWSGDALRLAMLRTHYRQPIDWTARELERAHVDLWEWYSLVDNKAASDSLVDAKIIDSLFEDLNTPDAIKRLHELAEGKEAGVLGASLSFLGFSCDPKKLARSVAATLRAQSTSRATVVGNTTFQLHATETPDHVVFHVGPDGITTDERTQKRIDELIARRSDARVAKNWAESDRLRDELAVLGVALKDNKDGTTSWEPKR